MSVKAVRFPAEKARKVPRQNRPKPGWYIDESDVVPQRRWRPYRLGDLAGAPPQAHPRSIPRGPRGGIRLAVGQVWVEIHGEKLWVIRHLQPQAAGRYRVCLSLYQRDELSYDLSSLTLKQTMKIWDEAAAFFREVALHLTAFVEEQGGGPVGAAQYFGIDAKTGERIHD